jgi:hypothetical protein
MHLTVDAFIYPVRKRKTSHQTGFIKIRAAAGSCSPAGHPFVIVEDCPTFPGLSKRLHWDLENPEDYTGTAEEILQKARVLRDRIRQLVGGFIIEYLI